MLSTWNAKTLEQISGRVIGDLELDGLLSLQTLGNSKVSKTIVHEKRKGDMYSRLWGGCSVGSRYVRLF